MVKLLCYALVLLVIKKVKQTGCLHCVGKECLVRTQQDYSRPSSVTHIGQEQRNMLQLHNRPKQGLHPGAVSVRAYRETLGKNYSKSVGGERLFCPPKLGTISCNVEFGL